jgi:hypothetical protein
MSDLTAWDYDLPWYHGSPLELTALREGSTITQNRTLARVFSHKPAIVSFGEDGKLMGHGGEQPGFIYRVAGPITPANVTPHPTSVMHPGEEWLTKSELTLALIGPTVVREDELLSADDVRRLREDWEARKTTDD